MPPGLTNEIHRRSVLQWAAAAGATVGAATLVGTPSWATAAGGLLPIVTNGKPAAVIVRAADADSQTRAAIDTLIQYVQRSTGATLAVISPTEDSPGLTRIHVGLIAPSMQQIVERGLFNLDKDGYVLFAENAAVTILGPTSWGTRFGVYEFLERYLGVRWLLPGPHGDDVPTTTTLAIRPVRLRQEPAYMSRTLSPQIVTAWNHADPNYMWSVHNRLHDRVELLGNLWSLFRPSKYGDPTKPETYRPEFFPIINGETFIPPDTKRSGWNPRFTAPGCVEETIKNVIAYFDARPAVESLTLKINDLGGFSEDEINPTKLNSFGFPTISDIYYRWVNDVIDGVSAVHPDKYYGLLAYRETADPPSFPLHPRAIPFMTRDRYGWVSDKVRSADMAMIEAWRDIAPATGLYDYTWGGSYCAPRTWREAMGESMRFGSTHHAVTYYAEAAQNWGEGPKRWIQARLLWDPNQSVEVLFREWCTRVAGNAGASHLIAHFNLWEEMWRDRVPATPWFTFAAHEMYFPFYEAGYLQVVTPSDIATLRGHIDAARHNAITEAQQGRVEIIRRQFEYYEASALSYPRKPESPTDSSSAIALLDTATKSVESGLDYAAKRYMLIDQFKPDPILKHSMDPRTYGSLQWSGWNYYPLWKIVTYVRAHEPNGGPVRQHVETLLAVATEPNERAYLTTLKTILDGSVVERGVNGSFENTVVDPWGFQSSSPPAHPFARTEQYARSGSASLRVPGGYANGSVFQIMNASPGFFRHSAWYYSEPGTPPLGTLVPYWVLYDANGKVIRSITGDKVQISATSGRWSEMEMIEHLPDNVARVRCDVASADLSADTVVFLDDITFTQTQQ